MMDSGNSSSMQSSSGGDDQEYESSGGLIGSSSNYFLGNTLNTNTNTSLNVNTTTLPSQFNNPPMFMLSSSPQQPPSLLQPQSSVSHHQHQGSYLDALANQQSNYHNLMFWRHQQHLGTGVGGGGGLVDAPSANNPSSSIANVSTHHGSAGGSLLVSSSAHQQQSGSNSALQSTSQKHMSSSAGASAGAGGGGGAGGGASSSGGSGKNPRKRTRASRRAPTTVLTTDTSNFRAMVQEFTGIPSSPFSAAASPLLSRRLTDLLTGSASTPGTTLQPPYVGHSTSSLERLLAGYNNSSSTYNFPLRPSAHKLSTTINNTQQYLNTTSNPTTISPLNNLTFQSLLQSTPSPRYQPSLAGAGLLPPNVGSFQDLSGVIGSDPMFGFAPMRLAPDGGGSSGGLRGGRGVTSNEESGDHGEGNIGAAENDNNNNNNVSNQQMVGSISGGGTSNYNVNMNCARDKGIDSSNPNRGSTQGTLGDFLG